MSPEPRFSPNGFVPTQEQIDIQTSPKRTILVEANAGAAKTTTLALRIAEALARGSEPEKILALVFTAEAQSVMRERLTAIGIASSLAGRVRVETFESFARSLLAVVEAGAPPFLATPHSLRTHVVKAIEAVGNTYMHRFDGLDVSTHSVAISQFLDAQMSLKARLALHRDFAGADDEDIAILLQIPITHLLAFREYERMRLGPLAETTFRGPFDATYDLACLLENEPDTHALPSCHLVVVDEFHDMNEAAFRTLIALLQRAECTFVGAGDKDQVIHSTLGADAQFLGERIARHFPAVTRLPLTATYRQGSQLAAAMGKFKNKPYASGITRTTKIATLTYADRQRCAELVADAVRTWKDETGSTADCAILLRDKHQSLEIENALIEAGFAYKCEGMSDYLNREEILFMRGILAIALNNLETVHSKTARKAMIEAIVLFGDVDLGEVYFPDCDGRLSHDAALEKSKTLIADDPSLLQTFFTGRFRRDGAGVRDRIIEVIDSVGRTPPETPAASVLAEVWQKLNLDASIRRLYVYPHEAEVVIRSVQEFVGLSARLGKNVRDFSEWIGSRDATSSKSKARRAIVVERVETSKGKEYGHVILPYLEAGEFPSRGTDYREDSNLFYVGATRAKSRLTLIMPEAPERRSPFVRQMALSSSLAAGAKAANQRVRVEALRPARIDLKVPYDEKDRAKELGARWDAVKRTWFIPAGVDRRPFAQWLPRTQDGEYS